jgi:Family of unknown function (DUF6209)
MLRRQNSGSRPQLTFTSDFHELVQGDLVPGPCLLRYDPLRLVDLGDASNADHVIRAYVRFHPQGSEWQGRMELPAGLPLAEMADASGQGLMLTTTFDIPEGCDELEVWFSCTHPSGESHWDSDYGKNHWLRFGLADIAIEAARVVPPPAGSQAQDRLTFKLSSSPSVDAVSVRWRLTATPSFPRQTTELVAGGLAAGRRTWEAPGGVPVPHRATVAFDVVYRVRDREFTDDNQGRWYIAD